MAEQYVLKLKIDDSDLRKLEKRLAGIMMGAGSGGGSGGKSGGGAGNQVMMKNIAKLGIISTGVMGLLAVTKKLTSIMIDSSPMLQQMLKLLNFSIMLIFRPIGDFIGFLLRPVIIFLLRKFIIPWYKDVYPVMKRLGTTIGNAITDVGKILFPANEDSAVTAAKLVALLGGGLVISVISARKIARLLVRRFPVAGMIFGRNAGNTFNSKVNKGAIANLKNLKPKGMNSVANKIINAFRMFSRIKFPTIPKPAWLPSFDTTVNKLVNLLTGGKGGAGGQNVQMGKPAAKANAKIGQPSWIKKFAGGKGGFGGGGLKGAGGGLGMKGKLGGFRGSGSGGLAFALAQFLDYVPYMPEMRDFVKQGMWDVTGGEGIDGTGIDKYFANLFKGGKSGNTSVVVNIQSIPDKSTADYLVHSLQSGLNK